MPGVACLAGWDVVVSSDAQAVAHAAAELRAHLARAGEPAGCRGTVHILAGSATVDAFTVDVADDSVTIRGDNPRGALNGVYWLLEELGFAWVEPGDAGVTLVRGHELAPGRYRQAPSFPRRTLILGQDVLHDDWQAWMEWASRNRLNDIFFHDTPPSRLDRSAVARPHSAEALAADRGGWLFERWDSDGPRIRAEAATRGLTVQFGGHHLPALLPRDLFETHPDWFPLRDGERDPRYNLCVSSGAARHLRQAAEGFFGRFAGAGVYHLWADDIRGGGWCECDGCAALSPSDQALAATNVVAEVLARSAPGARLAHLAYHDTVEPPSRIAPAENVLLLWAPRERCYAHGIADAACARNRDQYWRPFLGLLARFDNDPARVQLFEYYSDAILFKGLAPLHLTVLPADAAAYAAAGAHNLQNLMVSDRPWVGPPWHAWFMARCAWDSSADPTRELGRFCAAAFPGCAGIMEDYYTTQEAAFRLLLDLHDLESIPRHDVLDFSDRPRATLAAKARELLEACALFEQAAATLSTLSSAGAAEATRLERERAQAAFVVAASGHLAHRTAAWDAALSRSDGEAALHLDHAERHLAALEEWDARWNDPAYAVITTGMRRAMHYHTAEVRRLIQ